jgi:hypothetical protein
MASLTTARAGQMAIIALSPQGVSPEGLAQHKLSRLLELRAVIDSLRCEREARDPLLSWIIERGQAES